MTRGVCCQGMFRGARGAVGCPSGQREQTVNLPRLALRRFESFPHHFVARGRSSVGRASAFQAEGHGFEPRRPLCTKNARVAQSVERVLGKDEVTGSIPVASSGRNGAWYVVSGAWAYAPLTEIHHAPRTTHHARF